MAEGLGAGGVEECKGFSPPSNPTTNAASPRVPFGSLISKSPTATPIRRTLTEDLGSAAAIRSAETTKRARSTVSAQWAEERLHTTHQRRTSGDSFLQHLDATCCTAAAAAEKLRSRRQQQANSAAAAATFVQAQHHEEAARLAANRERRRNTEKQATLKRRRKRSDCRRIFNPASPLHFVPWVLRGMQEKFTDELKWLQARRYQIVPRPHPSSVKPLQEGPFEDNSAATVHFDGNVNCVQRHKRRREGYCKRKADAGTGKAAVFKCRGRPWIRPS